jgi:hypothetical protein
MKKDKKSQLKIQEMSFMLLAVILFFVLAALFFIAFRVSSMKGDVNDLKMKEAMSIADNIAKMPEFSCGETNCIDTDKLMIMKGKDYADFFPVKAIKVDRIYPRTSKEGVKCEINNYPDCDIYNVLDKDEEGIFVSSYVALCRKEKLGDYIINKCEIGVISVKY